MIFLKNKTKETKKQENMQGNDTSSS